MNVEQLVKRVMELEDKYWDLQERYQLLIHQYEQLKEKYEVSPGYRDGQQAQEDSSSSNAGH